MQLICSKNTQYVLCSAKKSLYFRVCHKKARMEGELLQTPPPQMGWWRFSFKPLYSRYVVLREFDILPRENEI